MVASGHPKRRRVWYGVAGIAALLVAAVLLALAGAPLPLARNFYSPSEGMTPTLLKNDRFLAIMRPPNPLRRGDIILFRVDNSTYVKRIAGLPGDRIALRNGIVILNGQPVSQTEIPTNFVTITDGPESTPAGDAPSEKRLLREQFPGETGPHEILDEGRSFEDDYPETRVLPGHVFVLGDNRDNSADSRIPRAEEGVEQLPITDITGTPAFYTWGPSHKFGKPIH
jgi:signal peptidase I